MEEKIILDHLIKIGDHKKIIEWMNENEKTCGWIKLRHDDDSKINSENYKILFLDVYLNQSVLNPEVLNKALDLNWEMTLHLSQSKEMRWKKAYKYGLFLSNAQKWSSSSIESEKLKKELVDIQDEFKSFLNQDPEITQNWLLKIMERLTQFHRDPEVYFQLFNKVCNRLKITLTQEDWKHLLLKHWIVKKEHFGWECLYQESDFKRLNQNDFEQIEQNWKNSLNSNLTIEDETRVGLVSKIHHILKVMILSPKSWSTDWHKHLLVKILKTDCVGLLTEYQNYFKDHLNDLEIEYEGKVESLSVIKAKGSCYEIVRWLDLREFKRCISEDDLEKYRVIPKSLIRHANVNWILKWAKIGDLNQQDEFGDTVWTAMAKKNPVLNDSLKNAMRLGWNHYETTWQLSNKKNEDTWCLLKKGAIKQNQKIVGDDKLKWISDLENEYLNQVTRLKIKTPSDSNEGGSLTVKRL